HRKYKRDKYKVQSIEQLISDTSGTFKSKHFRGCTRQASDDHVGGKTNQKGKEEDGDAVKHNRHDFVHTDRTLNLIHDYFPPSITRLPAMFLSSSCSIART